MEFTEGLFRGFKTLNSLLPKNNIWCRITEIVLMAHPIKLSKRYACYKVGYWEAVPNEASEPATPLSLRVNGTVVDTFYVLVDSDFTELTDIEKICFSDFITNKVIGKGYLSSMDSNRLLNYYGKYPFPHSVTTDINTVYKIQGFSHKSIYRSVDMLGQLTLISEVATIRSAGTSHDFAQPYLKSNGWVTAAVLQFILPNTLKAIVTITY